MSDASRELSESELNSLLAAVRLYGVLKRWLKGLAIFFGVASFAGIVTWLGSLAYVVFVLPDTMVKKAADEAVPKIIETLDSQHRLGEVFSKAVAIELQAHSSMAKEVGRLQAILDDVETKATKYQEQTVKLTEAVQMAEQKLKTIKESDTMVITEWLKRLKKNKDDTLLERLAKFDKNFKVVTDGSVHLSSDLVIEGELSVRRTAEFEHSLIVGRKDGPAGSSTRLDRTGMAVLKANGEKWVNFGVGTVAKYPYLVMYDDKDAERIRMEITGSGLNQMEFVRSDGRKLEVGVSVDGYPGLVQRNMDGKEAHSFPRH